MTIKFAAKATREFKAAICMNEEFYRLSKLIFDETDELINFMMGFIYIQVPGNSKMAIDMQYASIFDYTQIVQVDPIHSPMLIHMANHFFQQINIRFIHNASNRGANDPITCANNDERKYDGHCAIYPGFACKINQSQAGNNAQR